MDSGGPEQLQWSMEELRFPMVCRQQLSHMAKCRVQRSWVPRTGRPRTWQRGAPDRDGVQLLRSEVPAAILKHQGRSTVGQHLNPFSPQVSVLLAIGHDDAELLGVPLDWVLCSV